jgi:F0F1-type ATP synthase membrane subunit c/vacuolar-type H+-ATPase subunit K
MAPELKIERIIWAALLVSIAIYGHVAFLVGRKNAGRPFGDELRDPRVMILYALCALTFPIAFVMRAWLRERGAPRRLYNIIGWALFESITIYGLVPALILSDWRLIAAPAALSISGFILTFPSEG